MYQRVFVCLSVSHDREEPTKRSNRSRLPFEYYEFCGARISQGRGHFWGPHWGIPRLSGGISYRFPSFWNFPSSLESTLGFFPSIRQSGTNLSNTDSPNPLSGTSPIGSIDSPLSSSITPSLFHSRLKTTLFCKSFPP